MSREGWLPRPRREVVVREDAVRGGTIVVQPERLARLNATAATILGLCDGTRTVDEICVAVRASYPDAPAESVGASVERFLDAALAERWIE